MRKREKALLVEWLIKFGTDWVRYKLIKDSGLQFEVGRLERMHYLEYEWDEGTGSVMTYKITDKALTLLKEDDRE
jgi:hypothetical protein